MKVLGVFEADIKVKCSWRGRKAQFIDVDLPVNDDGVRGRLVAIPTALLVTTSTAGEKDEQLALAVSIGKASQQEQEVLLLNLDSKDMNMCVYNRSKTCSPQQSCFYFEKQMCFLSDVHSECQLVGVQPKVTGPWRTPSNRDFGVDPPRPAVTIVAPDNYGTCGAGVQGHRWGGASWVCLCVAYRGLI